MLAVRVLRITLQGACNNHLARPAHRLSTFAAFSLGQIRPIRTARSSTQSIVWLTPSEAEAILHENEASYPRRGASAAISQFDFNVVAANPKCEDAAAHAFVDGRHYYAIFDGHAGHLLSHHLAHNLIARVATTLRDSQCRSDEDTSAAIKRAFVELDDEITRKPTRLLDEERNLGRKTGRSRDALNNLYLAWELATQGSCALLLIVDEARDRLHIAVTGDSRAVMGTWKPSDGESGGIWCTCVLTEDQTSANPKEARRLQAEHPANEAAALVKNGRTLDLGMSRAFGDSMMKWTADEIRTTARGIFNQDEEPYPDCKTPPYITARPEVTSLPLMPEHGRRFVVLASDGLYEWLPNVDVVGLVGGFLDGQRGSLSRATLTGRVVMDDHPPGTYLPSSFHGPHKREFVFADSNIATHIIRNAIAGNSIKALQMQYSLPPNMARNHRDDMAVLVVVIGDAPGLRDIPNGYDIQG